MNKVNQNTESAEGDAVPSPLRRKILGVALAGSVGVSLAGRNAFGAQSDTGNTNYAATIADGRIAIAQAMKESNTTSVSVALVDGSRVVWQQAFGVIDRVHNHAASVDTLYNIGSVSKVVVSTAVMILVDRGKVNLDAPITTYIHDFKMLSPAYEAITVRMLLDHTSGFPGANYRNIFTFRPLTGYARDTQSFLAAEHLKNEPGEMAVYCNDGFTMAERVVEEVSGKAYAQFVKDEILVPLKMSRSRFPLEYYADGSFAYPYLNGKKYSQEFVLAFGSGGLSSTPADMMRLAMMFINDGELEGQRVLSKAAVEEMGQDQTANLILNPTPVWKWGIGWDQVEQPGMKAVGFTCWQKNGGTAFYGSDFYVLPGESLALMITGTSLTYGAAKLAERILLHALKDKHLITALPKLLPAAPPPIVPASNSQLDAMTGYYANYEGVMKIVRKDAQALSLLTLSAGQWTVTSDNLRLRKDGWFATENSPRSLRAGQISPYSYLYMRAPGGYGHYYVSIPLAERVEDAPPLSSAWQARVGNSWLLANDDESTTTMATTSPLVTLEGIPELPGYVRIDGRQLLLPGSDTRTREFIKIPAAFGRDLDELVVLSRGAEEWLMFGGFRYRPLASVPSVGPGTHAIQLDNEGNAQYLQLIKTGTVQVSGLRAWRLYDAKWNTVQAGTGSGRIVLPTTPPFYLMVFGDPNSRAVVMLA